MTRSGGRGLRRGRKAGTGLEGARRASPGRSRDSRPSRQRRSPSAAVNTRNSSPSSKTARFTCSGAVSSCGIDWRRCSWSPGSLSIPDPDSPSTLGSLVRRRCSLPRVSARRRHSPPGSFSSGHRAQVSRMPHICRRRAGSRDTCTPSTAPRVDSTF